MKLTMRNSRLKIHKTPCKSSLILSSKNISSSYQENSKNEKNEINGSSFDGTKLIRLDAVVNFATPGGWMRHLSAYDKQVYVATGFGMSTLLVSCSSVIEHVNITAICAAKLVVQMKECETLLLPSKSERSEKNGVECLEIPVSNMDDSGDHFVQRIAFQLPQPCYEFNAMFQGTHGEFLTVLDVSCFSTSMPSSMSTPVDVRQQCARSNHVD
mmetsp:Transcript_9560/g.14388  ORF Transcript_9560/g.14388 Transcript_9560/m.14388 type:complete len:213 (+) Transcript_9560:189-827(+)